MVNTNDKLKMAVNVAIFLSQRIIIHLTVVCMQYH